MAPYITLFGRTAGSYGLCSVLGLLVSGFVAIRLGRRRGVPSYLVIQAAVSALVGLLVGGHLLYGLLHLPERLTQPALVTFLRCFSGSVYYGGFLGACLSVHWYARHFAPNQTGLLTDLFACAVPLFHAFGRGGVLFGRLLLRRSLPVGLYGHRKSAGAGGERRLSVPSAAVGGRVRAGAAPSAAAALSQGEML